MKVALSKLLALLLCSAFFVGCAVNYGHHASNNPTGELEGEACMTNTLGMIATGDASVQAAAEDGGISEVATVDVKGESGFITGEVCTIVTGQ